MFLNILSNTTFEHQMLSSTLTFTIRKENNRIFCSCPLIMEGERLACSTQVTGSKVAQTSHRKVYVKDNRMRGLGLGLISQETTRWIITGPAIIGTSPPRISLKFYLGSVIWRRLTHLSLGCQLMSLLPDCGEDCFWHHSLKSDPVPRTILDSWECLLSRSDRSINVKASILKLMTVVAVDCTWD